MTLNDTIKIINRDQIEHVYISTVLPVNETKTVGSNPSVEVTVQLESGRLTEQHI